MDIYTYCFSKIERGSSYSIDFKTRTLKLGKETLILNGDIHVGFSLAKKEESIEDVMREIEGIYYSYKHSIPSEKSDSVRRCYFKALKEEELSDDDMMFGMRRMQAKFDLEYYVLKSIIAGNLKWQDGWGWFWQSENDKDLVILRSWVVGE